MHMLLERKIYKDIKQNLFKNKALILYGPRQVGKTTLIKTIQKEYPNSLYLNCDEPDIRERLTNTTTTNLILLFEGKKLILIDEAQRVENVGLTLKLIVDELRDVQVIATGSSSFDLSSKIREPLTGRKIEYMLFPPLVQELSGAYSDIELKRLLDDMLVFGNYPAIRFSKEVERREQDLYDLATSYVYKDILQIERIKYPERLEKLLRALAYQVGNEVSYAELATICSLSRGTVEEYIRILEQAYIIFKLEPYATNKRNTLKKMRKIYFYDTGIRNAFVRDFRSFAFRNDTGALFENFFISEKIKKNATNKSFAQHYFWRSYSGEEIDYLEEDVSGMRGFECKVKYSGSTITKSKNAPLEKCSVVTKETITQILND